jgi:hypothetical protein
MQGLGAIARLGALALGSAVAACSVEVGPDRSATESTSTRAVVTVTRSAPAASPEDGRADAFAGFLRTPADADAGTALRLSGLGLELPPAGECRKGSRNEGGAATQPALTRLELLDAGEVTIAAGGSVTTLAPRAFPTITDSIAGVVYTTRDRATPLPAGTAYTIATTGSSSLTALSSETQAPALLSNVELGGQPLGGLETLPAQRDLAVSWVPGGAADRVYLELEDMAGSRTCTFADETGHGVIPAAMVPSGVAAVTVHRLHEAAFGDPSLTRGAVRFDFELSASVTFE